MHARITLEGYLRIATNDTTEGYALRILFEKSPANSGMLLNRDKDFTTLEIPEGYPKIPKKRNPK